MDQVTCNDKDMPTILVSPSVTRTEPTHRGAVLVAGSHGGLISAYLAAAAGVHAVILSDAGVGLDKAGIAGLGLLDGIAMAAATVDAWSARIGDGADMLARGIISHANHYAETAGVRKGMTALEAAMSLRRAGVPHSSPPVIGETVHLLHRASGCRTVWGIDSASLAASDHDDAVLITGSHGGLLGGCPEQALHCNARAAVFNDAGIGIDAAGFGRLSALDARRLAAATVDVMTARIGDARSTWETGIISRVNRTAEQIGAHKGMTTREFVELFLAY